MLRLWILFYICGCYPLSLAWIPAKAPRANAMRVFSTASVSSAPIIDWDWQEVAESAFENSTKPILLFDGVCNFCNGAVNMCLDLDPDAHFRFASLQSRVGQSLLIKNGKAPNDTSSLVLVIAPDEVYFHSDAVLMVGKDLQGLPSWVRQMAQATRKFVPSPIRDGVYKLVAKYRFMFGESEGPSCRIDLDGSLQGRFVDDPGQ